MSNANNMNLFSSPSVKNFWGTQNEVLEVIHGVFPQEKAWEVLAARENLVLGSEKYVIKIAQSGKNKRLLHGLKTAIALNAEGIPVVSPLENTLIDTHIGSMSIWPRVDTPNWQYRAFDKESGFYLG